MNSIQFARGRRLLMAVACSLSVGVVFAQAEKSIAVERVPAFPMFEQWASPFSAPVADAPVGRIQALQLAISGAAVADLPVYQPLPVIKGVPELPLVGPGATGAAKAWGASLNYQGVYMRQVVLDARGSRREVRSMAHALRAGEHFKVRITATFDGVADVDQVQGDAWYGKRVGQVYPVKGTSVQMKAGETIELPLGADEYFVLSKPGNERLVVSVRHAKAVAQSRSDQPAYRQDGKSGSSYLQLVPLGTFPAFEQQVSRVR